MVPVLLIMFGLLSSSFAVESNLLTEFSTGYSGFSADIYKELSKSKTGNFLVCPLSLDIALALAEGGARNQTAEELRTVLRLPNTRARINEMFKAVLPNLQNGKSYTLSTANKIYLKEGFVIDRKFRKLAIDVFDSEVEAVEFKKNKETADIINKWVEEKTNNKIKDLINPSMLDSYTRAVIVNAIFFHGKWVKGFTKGATKKHSFYLNSKQIKQTDMMHAMDYYSYYESSELNAKFLKMDYEGNDVSMHIVLPNEIEGLAALQQKLEEVLNPPKYENKKVSVRIPKFKMETEIEFKPILKALGVTSAFERSANFSGILASEDHLMISEIIQKTFVEVEEEGTTAAAATAVVIVVPTSAMIHVTYPKEFHADHPFLFYLRLNKLGINFFVGKYVSP